MAINVRASRPRQRRRSKLRPLMEINIMSGRPSSRWQPHARHPPWNCRRRQFIRHIASICSSVSGCVNRRATTPIGAGRAAQMNHLRRSRVFTQTFSHWRIPCVEGIFSVPRWPRSCPWPARLGLDCFRSRRRRPVAFRARRAVIPAHLAVSRTAAHADWNAAPARAVRPSS